MENFEQIEYEQCLTLLKYYDNRQLSIVKFATGLSSAVPSIMFAFRDQGQGHAVEYWQFAALLCAMTALSLVILFLVLVQNRLYFVYPARQVNAIRGVQFSSKRSPKFQNQMYSRTDFNAFKLFSVQTLINIFVVIQIGLFVGLTYFSVCNLSAATDQVIAYAILTGTASSVVLWAATSLYLFIASRKHPDISIHGGSQDVR